MSCQFTDYCLLFTVHCSLKIPPTISYQLSVISYQLSVIRCELSVH
ncbi:hypothetical protein MICAI_2050009 [Microcystis sp. T1-4]|nr:hypothetical protein MICAI_2050009 [Microcystis sp. T1-4]